MVVDLVEGEAQASAAARGAESEKPPPILRTPSGKQFKELGDDEKAPDDFDEEAEPHTAVEEAAANDDDSADAAAASESAAPAAAAPAKADGDSDAAKRAASDVA